MHLVGTCEEVSTRRHGTQNFKILSAWKQSMRIWNTRVSLPISVLFLLPTVNKFFMPVSIHNFWHPPLPTLHKLLLVTHLIPRAAQKSIWNEDSNICDKTPCQLVNTWKTLRRNLLSSPSVKSNKKMRLLHNTSVNRPNQKISFIFLEATSKLCCLYASTINGDLSRTQTEVFVIYFTVIFQYIFKGTDVISINFSYSNPALNLSNTKWKW